MWHLIRLQITAQCHPRAARSAVDQMTANRVCVSDELNAYRYRSSKFLTIIRTIGNRPVVKSNLKVRSDLCVAISAAVPTVWLYWLQLVHTHIASVLLLIIIIIIIIVIIFFILQSLLKINIFSVPSLVKIGQIFSKLKRWPCARKH